MTALKFKCIAWLRIAMVTIIVLAVSFQAIAQNSKLITGTVSDGAEGIPLTGVNIIIKGSKAGTITDRLGKFSIQARNTDTLMFSFSGFRTQEILIGNRTSVNITLMPAATTLEDVVVIGYGDVKKKDLTGSVSVVKMDDMEKAPVASFDQALAGRVAGIQVTNMDGQPGSAMSIIIRGANSLTQSNSPLYVIDGFPIENPNLAFLNPDDILSVTILKDASSTAIYGSRGANGVVVIETKKGKSGKPVITFNNQIGFQKLIKKMDLMNPYEFVKYQYEQNPIMAAAYYSGNGRTLESYKDIQGDELQNHLFQTAFYRNHSLALRGESGRTNYSLSGSINNQQGVILNSGYNRYQGRVSIDQSISPKLKTGVIINYSNSNAYGQKIASEPGFQSNAIMWKAWGWRPVASDPNLNLLEQEADIQVLYLSDVRLNPLITVPNEHIVGKSANLLGNVYLQYNVLKDLTIKVTGSAYNTRIRDEEFYNSHTTQGNALIPGNTKGVFGSVNFTDINVWSNENTITYNKAFNKNHRITVLGGFSMQGASTSLHGHSAQRVPNETLGIAGLDEGVPLLVTASESRNMLQSFFSRLTYNYKSKYLCRMNLL